MMYSRRLVLADDPPTVVHVVRYDLLELSQDLRMLFSILLASSNSERSNTLTITPGIQPRMNSAMLMSVSAPQPVFILLEPSHFSFCL